MSYWEAIGQSNDWFTPPEVFEALGETFDLDVAHPVEARHCYAPAIHCFSRRSLETPWFGFVWMNPPFEGRNGIAPWLDKFFEHGNGIALTPDRTSAPWFQKAWQRGSLVLFTKKLKFIRPDGSLGKSPSNGTALWAAGERAEMALRRAETSGFGILAQVDRNPEGEKPQALSAEHGSPVVASGDDAPSLCQLNRRDHNGLG